LESYKYLGLGAVVERDHPQTNVNQTLISQTGGTGDAGDQYVGLDRFGRVVDDLWTNTSTTTTTDEFKYALDLVGNRTAITNVVNSSFNQSFTYDNLDQLLTFTQGTHTQNFGYDAVGNATSVTTDGTTQTRSANAQNQYTSISGATTPTYDSNGNMTTDETGRQFVYDAWNRLVAVKNSGGTTLETFSYDGLGRRITQTASGTTTDLYYSTQGQVLEEMVGGAATARYVWSPVYVNAMVLRDCATGSPGTLNERLWVQQDANWNVTALVNGSGVVVERYVYDPYGKVTIYSPDYSTVRSSSSYAMNYLFQGMRYDSTSGLYETQHRWYSPTLQRWVSLDPIRFAGGDIDLYRFVRNNPENATDPNGLRWVDGGFGVGRVTLLYRFSVTQRRVNGRLQQFDWINPRGAWAVWEVSQPADAVPGRVRYDTPHGFNHTVVRRIVEGPPIVFFHREVWVDDPPEPVAIPVVGPVPAPTQPPAPITVTRPDPNFNPPGFGYVDLIPLPSLDTLPQPGLLGPTAMQIPPSKLLKPSPAPRPNPGLLPSWLDKNRDCVISGVVVAGVSIGAVAYFASAPVSVPATVAVTTGALLFGFGLNND